MVNKGFDKDRYYFKNGTLYANSDRNATAVLIGSENDLQSEVLRQMEPGTIAHLPGWRKIYELSPAHTWIQKIQNDSGSSGGGSSGEGTVINDGDDVIVEGLNAEERANTSI